MNEDRQDLLRPRANRCRDLKRLALPPAASLAVHAGLVAAVALVSTRLIPDEDPGPRPPLAEVTLEPRPHPAPNPNPTDQPPEPAANPTAPARATPPGPRPAVPSLAPEPAPRPVFDTPTPTASPTRTLADAAPAPAASFAGVQAVAARRIVYVVDASGSVVSTFSFIRDRLRRSIDRLGPDQRFAIVFFRDVVDPNNPDDPPDLLTFAPDAGTNTLAPATPANRAAAARWIDTVQPAGRSDPIAGLARAMDFDPDLVFLLAAPIERTHAAWAGGPDAALATLDRLNPADPRTDRRPAVIKSISFLRPDPSGLLDRLAASHGDGPGSLRVLPLDQLDKPDPESTRLRVDTSDTAREAAIAAAARALADLDETGIPRTLALALPLPGDTDAAARTLAQARATLAALRHADDPDDRLTLLAARADLLEALLADPPRRTALASAAADAAASVPALGDPAHYNPAPELARLETIALARFLAADPTAASAATELAQAAHRAHEADPSATWPAALQAEALAIRLLAEPDRRSYHADTLARTIGSADLHTDPRWRLLAAAADARARVATNAPHPFAPLLALDTDPVLAPYTPHLVARLADAMGPAFDPTAADPRATLSIAMDLGRSPATRAKALSMLDTLARLPNTDIAPEALWESAALRALANDPAGDARAAAALRTLATTYPNHPRARAAAVAALRLDRRPAADRRSPADADLLRRAIDADPTAPEADRWRLDLAPLVAATERFELLTAITPNTREARDASPALVRTTDERLASTHDPAPILARAVRALDAAPAPVPPRYLHQLGILALDGTTNANPDPELARKHLARALAEADTPPASWHVDLARAERASGDAAAAFARLRPIAAAADPSDPAYWPAWTLLLEITADVGDAQAKADARAHLARLRLTDPSLGGPPWAARLRALERTLAP